MIQSKTARKMLYSWHGGQACPLYAAASSGLVANWDALLYACNGIKVVKNTRTIMLNSRSGLSTSKQNRSLAL